MTEKTEIVISAVDKTKEAFAMVESHVDRLKGVATGLDTFASKLPVIGTALTAAFGGASLAGFVNHSIDVMAALNDMAIATGASVESLSAMKQAAKLAGTSLDEVSGSLKKLGVSLGEAKLKGGDKAKLFEAIGIDPRTVTDTGQGLFELAKKLDAMPDKFKAMSIAKDLAGKNVSLPFLNELAQQEALIAKVTTEQAAAADRFSDNMIRLRGGAGQIGIALANSALPAMNEILSFSLEIKKEWGTISALVFGLGGGTVLKLLGMELDPLKRAANETKDALNGLIEAKRKLADAERGASLGWDDRSVSAGEFLRLKMMSPQSAGADVSEARSRLRASLKEQARLEKEKTDADYREALRKKNGINPADGSLGTKEPDQFTPIVRQIDERTAALIAEGGATDKLTEAQKLALKVMTDIQGGYLKLTTAQKVALTAKLELMGVNDRQVQALKDAKEQEKDYAEAVEKLIGPLERQAAQLVATNAAFGLTEAEVQRNIVATLEEARAIAAANGAWEQHLSFLDRDIEARKRLADASEAADLNRLVGAGESAVLERSRKEMLLLVDALEKGKISEEQYVEAVTARLNLVADKTKEIDSFARDMGLTFSSAFEDAIVEGKKFSEVLVGLEKDILRIVVRKSITEPIGGAIAGGIESMGIGAAIGGFFKDIFGGFRAGGGSVDAGRLYMVGERGPELFAPGASGSIIPNGAMGGSAPQVEINFSNTGTPQRVVSQQSSWDGRKLVLSLLTADVRNGGEFSQALEGAYGLRR
jgi:hypothetical protein